MDDGGKYSAFKVPRREAKDAITGEGRIPDTPKSAVPLTDYGFAEIEFGALPNRTAAGEAAQRFFSPATQPQPQPHQRTQPQPLPQTQPQVQSQPRPQLHPQPLPQIQLRPQPWAQLQPQPLPQIQLKPQTWAQLPTQPQAITQKALDPIRQKFFDMRNLASNRPFARDDAELFHRQAKFMEDFTDDYEGDEKMQMYFPYYQHMGYEQLRTYFTWRAKARQGEMPPISVSYAFLYIYELLSGIGASGPEDGLNKLVAIWDTFLRYGPALLNYLPQWFKDYHIYYETKNSFADFVKEHKMHRYFPEMFLLDTDVENSLEVWNRISDYIATGSKFYRTGNEQLMGDCLKYVVTGIREMCDSIKIHHEDLFIYRYSRAGAWYPFKQALFYPCGNQPDRTVNMPGKERYQCKNNRWSAYMPIYYSGQKSLVGKVLKKMESCLRKAMKYKYQIKSEPCTFYRSSGTAIEFDGVVEKAVADFIRDRARTVVTVDHTNLARIRKEALGTQQKLIVPENEAPPEAKGDEARPAAQGDDAPFTALGNAATHAATYGDAIPAAAPSPEAPKLRDANDPEEAQITAYDGWAALKAALDYTERKALSIALYGGMDIESFADENGIMLEVLADAINEKAADSIGDSILELDGGVAIYDEYRDNVAKIAEGAY